MSAEHIQGRLEYGEDCDSEWWIARVGSTEQIAYTVPVRPGVARANARRLVACWNACEGLPDEFLNSNPIKQLVQSLWDRNSELEGQRDEALDLIETMPVKHPDQITPRNALTVSIKKRLQLFLGDKEG